MLGARTQAAAAAAAAGVRNLFTAESQPVVQLREALNNLSRSGEHRAREQCGILLGGVLAKRTQDEREKLAHIRVAAVARRSHPHQSTLSGAQARHRVRALSAEIFVHRGCCTLLCPTNGMEKKRKERKCMQCKLGVRQKSSRRQQETISTLSLSSTFASPSVACVFVFEMWRGSLEGFRRGLKRHER